MPSARKRKNPELPEGGAELIKKPVRGLFKNGKGGIKKSKGPVKWKKDRFEGLQAHRAKKDYDPGDPWPPHPRKSDRELRDDAKSIHDQVPEEQRKYYTVATMQDGDGRLYYTVNGNNTDEAFRRRADELGYRRISGGAVAPAGSNHAEQVAANALENGAMKPPVRLSPSRQPCDDIPNNPKDQGCRERVDGMDGISLVGWP